MLIDDEDNLKLVFKHEFRDKLSLRETNTAIRSMYEAPEIRGYDPITPAADLWSFGVIFYEMLTGKVSIFAQISPLKKAHFLLFFLCCCTKCKKARSANYILLLRKKSIKM